MTMLYRTPNIVIDRHEWHIVVDKRATRYGPRIFQRHRFRALGKNEAWQSIQFWVGAKPKQMWKFFQPFKKHIQDAIGSEKQCALAAAEWQRRDSRRRVA